MQVTKEKGLTRIQRERRAEILEAALTIFSEAGFRGASINEIAAKANMTTPRLLYHFDGKEALYTELLRSTLALWMEPLRQISADGDPVDEICNYIKLKLDMSKSNPRESRLFASEVLVGIKRTDQNVFAPLVTLFDEKLSLFAKWIETGRLAAVDPHHLIYSIWATTQHYADFEAQISVLSPEKMPKLYDDAETFLVPMYRKMLTPE